VTTAPPPWWLAALNGSCPRCGQGRLFSGLLTIRDRCDVCGLDLREHDSGDGPASLSVFVVGAVIVGLAFWVEFHFEPPLWVHIVLWPPVTVALTIATMRPLKAALVALQYKNRSREMGL
jgi:uncharacterized protein (DUF983 family)